MKRPEYVAAVTGVYRAALDGGNVTKSMMDTLYAAFNRQGFTDDYYTGRTGPHMFGIREEGQEDERFYKQLRQTYENIENPLVPVQFRAQVTAGRFTLTVLDNDGHSCTLEGQPPEQARVTELTLDALEERLKKTGGTPYYCTDVQASITPGVTLSAAAINALRRDVLNMLTAQRARQTENRLSRYRAPRIIPGKHRHPGLTIQVTNLEQITGRLLKMQPAVLYVPLHLLTGDPEFTRKLTRAANVCAVLPRIVHDGELPKLRQDMVSLRHLGVEEVLVGNLGLLLPARECRMRIRGDYSLNLYSSAAVNAAKELELHSACLSIEMTMPQIRDVSKALDCELPVYGRLPLMVTENCIIKERTGQCTCHLGPVKLKDKTGAEFPVIKDGNSCRSMLLNGKKLYWLDRQHDLSKLGLWGVRLCFTTENPREVDQVLNAYLNPTPFDPGACTRGLYLRGLD